MKNILLISVSAPPKSGAESIQSGRFLKYLSKEFEFYLITSSNERKGWKKIDHTLSSSGENIKKRVEIPVFSNMISRFARYNILPIKWLYPDPDFLFHFFGMWKLKWIKSIQPDLIYSRSMPLSSTFLAYKIKEKLNIPWIMHLSDPWAENPYRDIRYVPKDLKWEQKAFEKADIITLTSENALSFYQKRYPDLSAKILYFPNVYDPQINRNNRLQNSDKLKVIYSGNIYGDRSIDPFLKSMEYIESKNPELFQSFEFFIAGNIDEYNSSLINKNNRKNLPITLLGSLEHNEALRIIQTGHILLTIDKPLNSEIDNIFYPSKVMDYIAAKRIILGITNPGSPTYSSIHGKFGVCFNHSQSKEIGEYLIAMIKEFKNENFSIFKIEEEDQFFSAEYQASKLKSVFEQL